MAKNCEQDRSGKVLEDANGKGVSHLAHVADDGVGRWRVHLLAEHLNAVAGLAAEFAGSFGADEWARLAGRWHDVGKFQPAFQAYIRRASGLDGGEGGWEPGRVDHSSVGAIHAVEYLERCHGSRGSAAGRLLAYIIAGHHSGLPDWSAANTGGGSLEHRLCDRRDNYRATLEVPAAAACLEGEMPGGGPPSRMALALWLRMLFSALVDADFLDTESFMRPAKGRRRSGWRSLQDLAASFEGFMAAMPKADTSVNRVRAEILKWCRERASDTPGLFSLTVPTGGGKTLSSMAFALRHALTHGKRRIIYVIPYTSIIEQTADVLRGALAESEPWTTVLEHHSNLDEDKDDGRGRLASENWDAPVVVTTSVQFFESLFAARTSRARKLHNIAGSVVVLDEVQLLPADFLHPILDALQALSDHFGTTVLLMSATQPAWEPAAGAPADAPRLCGVREIVPDPEALHEKLRRVRVTMPVDPASACSWDTIAERMLRVPCVLCVVNRRQDARDLFALVRKQDRDAVHLSALMCGAHRSAVIADIRARLKAGRGVRVVSTQLVEAGVDIDFPVVLRALAGLDSIAQAGGRCNREGLLDAGEVHVFVPPSAAPPGILRKAESVTRTMLAEEAVCEGRNGLDPLSPDSFRRFFQLLYWLHGENLDKQGVRGLLDHAGKDPELKFSFRTAGERFRIIPEDGQLPVVVRWKGHPDPRPVEQALAAFESGTPDRWAFRALQRSIVAVPRWNLAPLLQSGSVRQIHDHLFLQEDDTLYDDRIGLRLAPDAIRDPEEIVI